MIRRSVPARECPPERPEVEGAHEARVRAVWRQRADRTGRGAPSASFCGRRVLTLESRRSPELALLVMNYGGRPFVAPAVREVPLESNDHVLAFAADVIRQRFGMVILMTGVGVRMMLKIVDPAPGREAFVGALARTRIAARGPKPVAAMREVGLTPWATAPGPNTWRELLSTLDQRSVEAPLVGLAVAIQDTGAEWRLHRGVDRSRSRRDRRPDLSLVDARRRDAAAAGRAGAGPAGIDVVLLTASIQLVHLMQVAKEMELEAGVRKGLERTVVASIGPMTSEELRRCGLPVDLEPSHPKMGFLVKEAAEQCDALIQVKTASNQ